MKPPGFRFRSLQARIVVVFLALLLTVQVAGYAFIHNAITDNARRHAQAELAVAERVFGQLLAQSAQRLAQAAQALVGDFALREAVATRDRPAIASILRRHHERVSADLAMVIGANGRLLAAASAPRGSSSSATESISSSRYRWAKLRSWAGWWSDGASTSGSRRSLRR